MIKDSNDSGQATKENGRHPYWDFKTSDLILHTRSTTWMVHSAIIDARSCRIDLTSCLNHFPIFSVNINNFFPKDEFFVSLCIGYRFHEIFTLKNLQ